MKISPLWMLLFVSIAVLSAQFTFMIANSYAGIGFIVFIASLVALVLSMIFADKEQQ